MLRLPFCIILNIFTYFLTSDLVMANACDNDNVVMSGTRSDGRTVSIVLNGDRINRTPMWNLKNSDPPLSIINSISVASDWASRKYKTFDTFEIESIAIRNYECASFKDRWYYFFIFTPINKGRHIHEIGNWVIVLMDGSIVEPSISSK